MARYDDAHKSATRARIVEAAGRRLKSTGIDGSGVSTLMKDAGLTNGAFYAHFDSKQDLVATVVAEELEVQRRRLDELPEGVEGVRELLRRYLSTEHRDHPEQGCPSAALLDEIARGPEPLRAAWTEGLLAVVDDMEARLSRGGAGGGAGESVDRARSLGVWALLIGTLQVSRALTDPGLSEEVVRVGLANACALLGLPDEP